MKLFTQTFALFGVLIATAYGQPAPTPMMKISARIETELFNLVASASQMFPDVGMRSEPNIAVWLATKTSDNLDGLKIYLAWDYPFNCSAFDPEATEKVYEITEMVKMLNSSDSQQSQNLTRSNTTQEESEADMDTGVFDLLFTNIVVEYDGAYYCQSPKIDEEVNMKKIELVFPTCSDFDFDDIKSTIQERVGIDADRIFIGRFEQEECNYADVYFQFAFDTRDILKKLSEAFSTKSGLGRFSMTDSCKTNILQSFVTKKALEMFFSSEIDREEPQQPLPRCRGISEQAFQEYRERIRKYDCVMSEYSKKYGIRGDSCSSKQTEVPQPTCDCSGGQFSVEISYITYLLQYVGAPVKLEELTMIEQQISGSSSGMSSDRLKELMQRLQEATSAQEEYYRLAYLGFCIVSGYDDYAVNKLGEVRAKVARGVDAGEIVKSLMREALEYYIGLWEALVMRDVANLSEAEMKEEREIMKLKMRILMMISDSCSTMAERERISQILSTIGETYPEQVEEFNEMIRNSDISNATRELAEFVAENDDDIARSIFLSLYSSMEIDQPEGLVEVYMRVMSAIERNKYDVIRIIRSWMMSPDVEIQDLFTMQILFMTPEDTRKGCDLKSLVDKVKLLNEPEMEPMDLPNDDVQGGGNWGMGSRMRRGRRGRYYMP